MNTEQTAQQHAQVSEAVSYLREMGFRPTAEQVSQLGRYYDQLDYAKRSRSNAWRHLAELWIRTYRTPR